MRICEVGGGGADLSDRRIVRGYEELSVGKISGRGGGDWRCRDTHNVMSLAGLDPMTLRLTLACYTSTQVILNNIIKYNI